MLNIYIINIENDKNKLENIIKKINNEEEINLMKVNPIFIERKENFYLKNIFNICDLFSSNIQKNYGITHLKLIENIYNNDNNEYSLIFENSLIPKYNLLNKEIKNIINNTNKNWDIIKLFHNNNNKKHIYEKIDNNTTSAYMINKKGIKKLLDYKYKKIKKINLNIYNSNNEIFELNVNNKKYDIINKIYYNVTLYFVEILFIMMIVITIGTNIYFVIKIK